MRNRWQTSTSRLFSLPAVLLLTACAQAPKYQWIEDDAPPLPPIVRPVVVPEKAGDELLDALVLIKEDNLRQAEANLEEIAKVRPDIPEAWLNLGWVRLKLGKYNESTEALLEGLKRRPNEPQAHNLIGLNHREMGRFKDAEAAYLEGLKLAPNDVKLHLNIGILYDLYLMKPAAALEHYRAHQLNLPSPDPKVAGWIAVLERMGGKP